MPEKPRRIPNHVIVYKAFAYGWKYEEPLRREGKVTWIMDPESGQLGIRGIRQRKGEPDEPIFMGCDMDLVEFKNMVDRMSEEDVLDAGAFTALISMTKQR